MGDEVVGVSGEVWVSIWARPERVTEVVGVSCGFWVPVRVQIMDGI